MYIHSENLNRNPCHLDKIWPYRQEDWTFESPCFFPYSWLWASPSTTHRNMELIGKVFRLSCWILVVIRPLWITTARLKLAFSQKGVLYVIHISSTLEDILVYWQVWLDSLARGLPFHPQNVSFVIAFHVRSPAPLQSGCIIACVQFPLRTWLPWTLTGYLLAPALWGRDSSDSILNEPKVLHLSSKS